MSKFKLVLLFLIVVFAGSGCSVYLQQQQFKQELKTCYADCDKRCQHCNAVCDDNPGMCQAKADALAAVHFNHYRHQQRILGQIMTKDLNAFRDPLACTKTTCDCFADRKMCLQACQGTIYKRLQPIAQIH